jgi:hypothetical protein
MSLAWGLAVPVIQSALYRWNGLTLPAELRRRMQNLLALFIVAVLFFVLVYHLTNGYFAKQAAFGVHPARRDLPAASGGLRRRGQPRAAFLL